MGLLSTKCQYNLLKRNIPTVELLLHIASYHFTTEEDLMDFALGEKDLRLWKVKIKIARRTTGAKDCYF